MNPMNRGDALGVIETTGLLASIEAADAMVKSAEVTLARRDQIGAGRVTLFVTGDLASVTAAVEAAVKILQRTPELSGRLLSSLVIPRPLNEVWDRLI